MATTLKYPVLGTIHVDGRDNELDKEMDLYLLRESNVPVQGLQFFVESSAKTSAFKLSSTSNIIGLPRESEDVDPLPVNQDAPGYSMDVTISTHRDSLKISRQMRDDDQSGTVMNKAAGLARANRRFLEYKSADVVNQGFTTDGADDTTLFASDHPLENASYGTWDNLESAAVLSPSSYNTMRMNMRKRKDEVGHVSPIMMKMLLVSADNEETAKILSMSGKRPQTANNDANAWQNLDYMVWDYLTSSTAWFGWGDLDKDQWGLHYVVRDKPEVAALPYPTADYPDIVAGWRSRIRVQMIGSLLKNMHANAGA